jgi:undecaprenyl-diphosphatase
LCKALSFSAVVVFGFLIYVVGRTINTAAVRIGTYFLSTLLIILIGVSRLYLNVHWPSILGGYVAGFIWLAFGVIVVNTIRQMVITGKVADMRNREI